MTITINAENSIDITEATARQFPWLNLSGFTILDRPGTDRFVWAYVITDGTGFMLSGVTDDLDGAVHKTALTARILRRDRGTTATVLIGHHTF